MFSLGGGRKSALCRVLRIWDQLWWMRQKVHLAQGVVLDHAWERDYEKQSMYGMVLAARFVPCNFVVKLNFEWGAVIWKPQFKSGCGKELMRVRRRSWSGKKCSWRGRKSSPLPCGVYSIPRARGCPRESMTINATVWRVLRLALILAGGSPLAEVEEESFERNNQSWLSPKWL